MVEAVTRAKGLLTLATELGWGELSLVVHLGTDSNAAKSFVSRRGLGKMRHLEIRDLWLQKEIREGRVVVHKVLGTENPADLMTKILTIKEIEDRLRNMSIVMRLTNRVQPVASVETSGMGRLGPTSEMRRVARTQTSGMRRIGPTSEMRRVARTQTSEIRRVGPTPISSFGAGQGENNISVFEWKG
jgi:hypothetical protein